MKRVGFLFDSIFTTDNLYIAYIDASQKKHKKRACFEFSKSLGSNLQELIQELHSDGYLPKPYFKFKVFEPKERTIHAPAFRDCVVQHAIYRAIYPIFNKTFINTSFACRKGYGTHKASSYTQWAMREHLNEEYFLKLDIRKFFYSIDKTILQKLIEQKIKDKRLVKVMMMYTNQGDPVGIPIGNLLSQLYALIYLNPLDHFVKHTLRVKHYVRYVDDFILIGLTFSQCMEYRARIVQFLQDELHLTLSKSTIQKVKRGINFVGYRTWQHRKLIRKHSMYKFRKAVKRCNILAIISLYAHALKTASMKYLSKVIKEVYCGKDVSLPKAIRSIQRYYSYSTG
jgi:retron-type reverse transcriptase